MDFNVKAGIELSIKLIATLFLCGVLAACGSGGDNPANSNNGGVPQDDPDGGETPVDPDGGATPGDPDGGATPGEPDGGATPGEPDGGATPGEPDGGVTPDDPDLVGLDIRPANVSCLAPKRPPATTEVTAEDAFPALKLKGLSITSLFQNGSDSSHWYMTSRHGNVYRFANDPAVDRLETVLDLTKHVATYYGELGLLNAVFHPDFPQDPRLFVYYVGLEEIGDIHLSSFTSPDNGATFDLNSEQVLLTLPQFRQFHKGGGLQFDKDGYLYLSIGDGGDKARSQDPNDLYGTLIKIDINSSAPYQSPADNPFVAAGGGAPEVLAYGLRNPWRFSIDHVTGEIWLGDVGANEWEEVNRIVPGGNYGWPVREGAHCWKVPDNQCDSTGMIDPVVEYSHEVGTSVIGGLVYRGSAIASLSGKYLYGDYRSGQVWALENEGATVISNEELVSGIPSITSFAQDNNGEVYITRTAKIHKLVPAQNAAEDQTIPQFLSESGCFAEDDPTTPLDSLIPYDVNSEFWSDGASKKRWLAVPDGEYVDIDDAGDFQFPRGSVLIKEFSLNDKRLETRFMVRHQDGGWGGYTYLWNDDQSDAELLRTGAEFLVGDQLYSIPNENQCAECHTDIANNTLGPELLQLNRKMLYPATGQTANQLTTLEHIGLFSRPLTNAPGTLAKLTRIEDESGTVEEKVRSYLHANCSQCHRPGGLDRVSADFRYQAEKGMGVCDVDPQLNDFGIEGAKLIAPGDPARSIVLTRMTITGDDQMPPISRNVPHAQAIDLLKEYITNLQSCD